MTRLQTALAIVVSLAATSSHSAHAGGDPPANSLDGKSFEGDGGMDTQEGQCPVAAAGVALDVHDPAPRSVFFEVEISSAPNGVGQVFGNADPAAWSASGNIGTLTISAATHESMRSGGGWTPVPGSFDPIVIQIDLTTLEATSTPASGAIEMGNLGLSFTQSALDSTAVVSYIGPDVDPFICTSQAEVDALCPIAPQFCGQLCIPVVGVAYGEGTGLLNLVGSETQTACDGAQCFGPFDFLATEVLPRGRSVLTRHQRLRENRGPRLHLCEG